jgi:hypothetical protein
MGGVDTALEVRAHEYAWNWFKYHSEQRNAAFRFFLAVLGILAAGLVAAKSNNVLFALDSVLIAATSVAFWRLDVRNTELIKVAENFLRRSEDVFAEALGAPEIKLAHLAERREFRGWIGKNGKLFRHLYSYSQIHRAMFLLTFLIGIAGFGTALWKITS